MKAHLCVQNYFLITSIDYKNPIHSTLWLSLPAVTQIPELPAHEAGGNIVHRTTHGSARESAKHLLLQEQWNEGEIGVFPIQVHSFEMLLLLRRIFIFIVVAAPPIAQAVPTYVKTNINNSLRNKRDL